MRKRKKEENERENTGELIIEQFKFS